MKIDKVIYAVDDSVLYQGFWEIVSKVCKIRLGIIPVLLHITNEESDLYEDEWGLVKKIKKVNGINTGYQAQNVRMWGCSLFPDEVCLTSDIDMLMLNKNYFIDRIDKYHEDSIIVYTSDAYGGNKTRYPICYNASKGKNFKKILNLPDSFEEYIRRLWRQNKGWSFDEQYYTNMLNRNTDIEKIYLNRGWDSNNIAKHRIDRVRWDYDKSNIDDYIDCHSLRPYNKYKEEIDKLVKILCQDDNKDKLIHINKKDI